nr:hypothetical protein [uncultured Desulfobacter sp.]
MNIQTALESLMRAIKGGNVQIPQAWMTDNRGTQDVKKVCHS